MYSLIFTTLLTIKNRSLFYCTIFETKKKTGVQRTPVLNVSLQISNYAATAGATRATGRDSPAARSRGKL